jgi:hypothetical protein
LSAILGSPRNRSWGLGVGDLRASKTSQPAAAYAGLADAYSYQAGFGLKAPNEVMPLAEKNAAKVSRRVDLSPGGARVRKVCGRSGIEFALNKDFAECP